MPSSPRSSVHRSPVIESVQGRHTLVKCKVATLFARNSGSPLHLSRAEQEHKITNTQVVVVRPAGMKEVDSHMPGKEALVKEEDGKDESKVKEEEVEPVSFFKLFRWVHASNDHRHPLPCFMQSSCCPAARQRRLTWSWSWLA